MMAIQLSGANISDPSEWEAVQHAGYALVVAFPTIFIALACTLGLKAVRNGDSTMNAFKIALVVNVLGFIVTIYRLVQSVSPATSSANDLTVFLLYCGMFSRSGLCTIFVSFSMRQLYINEKVQRP